jgi:oxygen-dependent protoporphyrinogen oxidase
MPRLLEAEARHGSVRRALARAAAPDGEARTGRPHAGSGGFASLQGGLGTLPQRLASLLPRGSIRLESRVKRVAWNRTEDGFVLELPAGERLEADAVVLTCPAHEAAAALCGIDPDLAGELAALEYSSCATVHLVYRRQDVGKPLEGHGFFVPKTSGVPLLACSYVSEKYPERARPGDVVLRAFAGGARNPQALELDDAALIARTHSALGRILDLRAQPIVVHVQRHLRAMPHYRVGDAPRLARIRTRARRHGGLVLAGGLRGAVGVPDVTASGKTAAEEVLASLRQRVPALRAAAE